jgi:mono/diheme cytochrome c family protein/DNA-binding beta-propeller fold protein YncE
MNNNASTVGMLLLTFCLCLIDPAGAAVPDAAALFAKYCASCHGADRLGAMGPVLLPESLQRTPKEAAAGVVAEGRPATRMPGFRDALKPEEIAALVDYLYTAPASPPAWDEARIRASRVVYKPESVEGNATSVRPVYSADPLNLFLVVEAGDHHVTVLDGDKLEPIFRFESRFALHGGPKFSSDGRFVYFASRDGWISKFDMYRLETVAEVRAGINTRNLAVSADDRYVLVGNYLPQNLVLLDARDLSLIKVIPTGDESGKGSRVSAVYTAPPRRSFIVALKDIKEVWEISYADHPPPVYGGLVHDYRMGEGLPETGRFPVRRIRLDDYLDDFFFDQDYEDLIGASRDGNQGQVVNLIVGRKIADVDLPGLPHLGSGITWPWHGTTVLATPNLREGVVSIIDMANWKTITKIVTLGPGFFMRSHENSRYAWVDVFSGPDKDAMQVIDKQTLEIARTLRPAPGKTSTHVEFTRDGKYALVSIWETDGAIVVYDAATLEEVKRLPMNKPVGKYNVYNKIHYAEGTSH